MIKCGKEWKQSLSLFSLTTPSKGFLHTWSVKPVCLYTPKERGLEWNDTSIFSRDICSAFMHLHQVMKKNWHGFVLFSVQRWARERHFSWERGRKGLSGFKTSWAQLMSDFCLTMASICFPSKRYMDRWALYCSKDSRRCHISQERTDFLTPPH